MVVGGHIAKSGYGDGLKGVRIFSRKTFKFTRVANMSFPRWYPTATLLPNGKVTIMGGTVLPGAGAELEREINHVIHTEHCAYLAFQFATF